MPVDALELQGHRGARGLYPENTLAGFERTLAIGVDTLEFDVAMTADGVVVVSHDPRLNPDITRDETGRWLSGPGPVIHDIDHAALTRYDVGAIKAGSRYASRFPDQQSIDGERIPALESVIKLADRLSGSTMRYNIEIKRQPEHPELTAGPEDFVRAVVAVLDRTGAKDRAVLQSFDWSVVREVLAHAPGIATSCLSAQQSWMDTIEAGGRGPTAWTAGIAASSHGDSVPDMVHALGADIWSPHYRDLDAAALGRARALGLRVIAWTVNEQDDMKALIELGVNGIISDYPDRLRQVAGGAGLSLPDPHD